MEDDFYASLKLISGEEVFAKVAACDEDNRTLVLLHNPVLVQQIKLPEVNIPSSITNNTITPPKVQVPEKSLDQIIKEKADARLKREQEAYDKEYGVGGIPKILRPE